MPEVKLLKEFKCPHCGEGETITGLALAEIIKRGLCKEGTPYSMQKVIVPLIDPGIAQLTVPVMIVHQDVCANCGTPYCIRVEAMDAPITMVQGPKGGLPPGFGRG